VALATRACPAAAPASTPEELRERLSRLGIWEQRFDLGHGILTKLDADDLDEIHDTRSRMVLPEIERAFSQMEKDRPDVLLPCPSSVLFSFRGVLFENAVRLRIPFTSFIVANVPLGVLFAYAASLDEIYRRAATYVAKILKGAKPGDLPIEQPTRFELVINLKTAKALGLTIPQSVLFRADQVFR